MNDTLLKLFGLFHVLEFQGCTLAGVEIQYNFTTVLLPQRIYMTTLQAAAPYACYLHI